MTPEDLEQIRSVVRETVRQELKTLDDRLTRYILDFRAEVLERFDSYEPRLQILSGTIQSIESKLLPFTKAVFDAQATVSRGLAQQSEAKEQWRIQLADIEARLRKLEGAA